MSTILARVTTVSFLAMVAVSAGPQPVSAQTPTSLTIASDDLPPYRTREVTGFEDILAMEMYRRLGIDIRQNEADMCVIARLITFDRLIDYRLGWTKVLLLESTNDLVDLIRRRCSAISVEELQTVPLHRVM